MAFLDLAKDYVSDICNDICDSLQTGSTSLVENVKIWYVGNATPSPQKTSNLLLKTKFGRKKAAAGFHNIQQKKKGSYCCLIVFVLI